MTEEVASEGIILLDNKNGALPLAQGSRSTSSATAPGHRVRRLRLGLRRREQHVTMAQGLTMRL